MRTLSPDIKARTLFLLSLFLLLLSILPASALAHKRGYDIWPVPQQQIAEDATVATTAEATLIAGSGCDPYTVSRAKAILTEHGIKPVVGRKPVAGRMTLLIGVNGSGDLADKTATRLSMARTVFAQPKYDRHAIAVAGDKAGNALVVVLGEKTDAVFCGSAVTCLGSLMLMDHIVDLLPNPVEGNYHKAVNADGGVEEFVVSPGGVPAAFVWKTVSDQFGKYSFIKVLSGEITPDTTLVNARTGETEKLGRMYVMCGKKNSEVKVLACGDIGAIAKMDKVKTGDTLCDPRKVVSLKQIPYPNACYSMAIAPKTRGQEEKVGTGLNRLNEEDPSFTLRNAPETKQLLLSGPADQQLDVLVSKLKTRFGVEAVLSTPKIAYRERIKKTVQAHGRHKKQTGGSGQFGDVWIRFEPQEEQDEMIFAEEVFGGSVPKNFYPAVEKGIQEAVQKGPLAGYPMVNLKAVLYDGSYHPVDSNEMAFKMAAILSYKEAMPNANPTILEPIGALAVTVPESYVGDVMGDLSKRRGRPMGMTPDHDGNTVIEAEVPMAEMGSYAIDLRAMTQARGSFTLEFVRYEEVPKANQAKIIADAKDEG